MPHYDKTKLFSQQRLFPIKLNHNSNFHFSVNFILFNQREEDPTVVQILEKISSAFSF